MRIALTKVSDDAHRLALTHDDGWHESVELASRSFLWHDFLHYAVETNAGLRQSFWGLLASGKTLAELHDAMGDCARPAAEAMITEAVVGVMTNVVRQDIPPDAAIEGLGRLFEAQGRDMPVWFTAVFVERVCEHMRRLMGEWRALPYGREMQLAFPAADAVQTKARPETGTGSREQYRKQLLT
jgi:hypothetical protein